jgi:hypothetical protein
VINIRDIMKMVPGRVGLKHRNGRSYSEEVLFAISVWRFVTGNSIRTAIKKAVRERVISRRICYSTFWEREQNFLGLSKNFSKEIASKVRLASWSKLDEVLCLVSKRIKKRAG